MKKEIRTKKTKRLPVIWQGREYYGINKFDCRIVDLKSTKNGGTYFTGIPISPLEYRKKNPTKAEVKIIKVEITKSVNYTIFIVYDDWGTPHKMMIPDTMSEEIKIAKQAAIDAKLLKK